MTRSKSIFAALLVIACVAVVPAASAAPVVHFLGVGSSAMYQPMGVAAYNDIVSLLASPGHYTVKASTSGCTGTVSCSYLHELRGTPGQIPDEAGNLWVMWGGNDGSGNATDVYAYLQVDSVVGNRAIYANPSPLVQLNIHTGDGVVVGQNVIDKNLFTDISGDASSIPAAVFSAINGTPLNAGLTDIRPEDAKFAQTRIVKALSVASLTGLGYTLTNHVGIPVLSSFTTTQATPVDFAIKGKDPISGNSVNKNLTTLPVGAEPIVFLINRKDTTGFGQNASKFLSATHSNLLKVFDGDECDGVTLDSTATNFPVIANLREPLSGTMNTTEFTVFRIKTSTAAAKTSQEKSVGQPVLGTKTDPLSATGAINAGGLPCKTVSGVTGSRKRAIGTGEMVGTAVNTPTSCVGGSGDTNCDAIGYAFYANGNFSKIWANANYTYLNLDEGSGGIDGTPNPGSTVGQEFQKCDSTTSFCPLAAGTSFPNLRNGTYRSWSLLRVITDKTGPRFGDIQTLIADAQNDINLKVPDFVPYVSTQVGEPGLQVYRDHYTQSAITGKNTVEGGGDVGGCIEAYPITDTNVGKRQGGVTADGGVCF